MLISVVCDAGFWYAGDEEKGWVSSLEMEGLLQVVNVCQGEENALICDVIK